MDKLSSINPFEKSARPPQPQQSDREIAYQAMLDFIQWGEIDAAKRLAAQWGYMIEGGEIIEGE